PTARLRRLRSTPTVEEHSTVEVSRTMQRQSLGSGKCERANFDSWLRHNRQRMIGQREREAFSSGDRNFQDSTSDFETITTDQLLSNGIGFSGREASPNRLLPRR